MDNNQAPAPAPVKSRARKVWEIFRAYFTAMLFAFTGGIITLPLQQQLLADKYGLTTRDKILESYALAQALPGVVSISAGVLIGLDIAGIAGAAAAVLGITAPAFGGMLLVTASYTFLANIPVIAGVIAGIRAASVAVILVNGWAIAAEAKSWFYRLVAAGALAATLLGVNVFLVILACGAAGILWLLYQGRRKEAD